MSLSRVTHFFKTAHSDESLPDNFKKLFTPLNQIHSYRTRSATRGAFFWQATRCGFAIRLKRLNLGPPISRGPKILRVRTISSISESSTFQNRRQKVFNRGALHLCGGGLDILKIDKNSTDL